MNSIFHKLSVVIKDPAIRKRILFTLGALVVFRLLSTIPIPGVDVANLERLLSSNQIFGMFSIFSGGGLATLSIVMLGVGPYITSSIIMQLLTMMFPKLKTMMQEEGEAGRQKLSQYSRLLSVPIAALQALGFLAYLASPAVNVIPQLAGTALLLNIIIITGASVLLMWVGELISEFGIGNGVSLIIFAGIVAALPQQLFQFVAQFDPAQIPLYLIFLLVALVVIIAVVVVTEAERPVSVTYAKQVRGNKVYGGVSTYLPLRLNQSGVMPIIFALSILIIPQMIVQFLSRASNPAIADFGINATAFLANQWTYGILYFFLVVLFTYFYTAVTFDPKSISENLQKGGAFIPGVRPGESTIIYLGRVVTRITLVGALFLGIIAVLPLILQAVLQNPTLAIGGTALLIVVSVVLDLLKKVDAQVSMREY